MRPDLKHFLLGSVILSCFLTPDLAGAANVVTVHNSTGFSGQSGTVTLALANEDSISGLQFTIRDVPNNLIVNSVSLAPRLSNFSTPAINDIDSLGIVRIVIFAFGSFVPPGSGDIFTIDYEIAPDTPPGDHDIIIEELVLSNPGAQNVESSAIDGVFTVLPQLTLEDHPLAQLSDQFVTPVEGRYALTRFAVDVVAETANITSIAFEISGISGVSANVFSDVALTEDVDGNGLIDPNETGGIGGAGIVTTNGPTGDITFSSPFSLGIGTRYLILEGTLDLPPGSVISVDLSGSGVSATGINAGVITPRSTVSSATHETGSLTLSDHIGAGQINDQLGLPVVHEDLLLFRFTVSASGDANLMTNLAFGLTLSGLNTPDLSAMTLSEDTNSDGLPDGPALVVGPAVTNDGVTFSAMDIDLTGSTVRSFVLTGTVAAHSAGDGIEISLDPDGVSILADDGSSLPSTGNAEDARHSVGSFVLSTGPSGPPNNQFNTSGFLENLAVHRFEVRAVGEAYTLQGLSFDLQLEGLTMDDIQDVTLFEDSNGDGISDGDPLASGLPPSVPFVPIDAEIAFTGLGLSVPGNASRVFIVKMSVQADSPPDAMTVTLAPSGVVAEDEASNPAVPTGVSVTASHRHVVFAIGDAATGQPGNMFDGAASTTDVPLFRFSAAAPVDTIVLRRIAFSVSLDDLDYTAISDVSLYEDINDDGLPDDGPLSAEVTLTQDQIVLEGLSSVVGTGMSYVLTASVDLSTVGARVSIDLNPAEVVGEVVAVNVVNLIVEATGQVSAAVHEVTGFAGDVTFDLTIDVLDVVKEVAIALGTIEIDGPLSLFDLDGNQVVNIVDVVGLINKALTGDFPSRPSTVEPSAEVLIVQNDPLRPVLRIDTPVAVAGIQISLAASGFQWDDIQLVNATEGLKLAQADASGKRTILFYSEKGNVLESGQRDILSFLLPENLALNAAISVEEVIVVDRQARELEVVLSESVLQMTLAPAVYSLIQNYPNPFNPTTTIRYELPKPGRVTLIVYNSIGQRVATLVDQAQPAGRHAVDWNARNDTGESVASGVFVYRISVDGVYSDMRKMVLLK